MESAVTQIRRAWTRLPSGFWPDAEAKSLFRLTLPHFFMITYKLLLLLRVGNLSQQMEGKGKTFSITYLRKSVGSVWVLIKENISWWVFFPGLIHLKLQVCRQVPGQDVEWDKQDSPWYLQSSALFWAHRLLKRTTCIRLRTPPLKVQLQDELKDTVLLIGSNSTNYSAVCSRNNVCSRLNKQASHQAGCFGL